METGPECCWPTPPPKHGALSSNKGGITGAEATSKPALLLGGLQAGVEPVEMFHF